MAQYEIEIKSLLGDETKAKALVKKMCDADGTCKIEAKSSQLNHYFAGGDVNDLYAKTAHLFNPTQQEQFKMIIDKGSNFSVRTRAKDEEILLVVKAALDGGTSANTVSRLEFEEPVAISLPELDKLVESAGYEYEAKWSRDREEYSYKGVNVCIDCNAGYGYLAEFETVTDDEINLDAVRARLEEVMAELEVEELPQDRLARMFAHYNENWADYYGTDKTFLIE